MSLKRYALIIEQLIAIVELMYFSLTLSATLIKLRLSLYNCSVYLCVEHFFPHCCRRVSLILLLFQKVILRSLPPLSFKISHSWRDFNLTLIIRQLSAPLPPQVTRTCSCQSWHEQEVQDGDLAALSPQWNV